MSHKETIIMVLKLVVDLHCPCCYKNVKKLLCKFPEVRDQKYDEKENTVTIRVLSCCPEKIRDELCCKGSKLIKSIEIIKNPIKPPRPVPPLPIPRDDPPKVIKPTPDPPVKDKVDLKPEPVVVAVVKDNECPKPGPDPVVKDKVGPKCEPIITGPAWVGNPPPTCWQCNNGGRPCFHGCGHQPFPPPRPCFCGCGGYGHDCHGHGHGHGHGCGYNYYCYIEETPNQSCSIM